MAAVKTAAVTAPFGVEQNLFRQNSLCIRTGCFVMTELFSADMP